MYVSNSIERHWMPYSFYHKDVMCPYTSVVNHAGSLGRAAVWNDARRYLFPALAFIRNSRQINLLHRSLIMETMIICVKLELTSVGW